MTKYFINVSGGDAGGMLKVFSRLASTNVGPSCPVPAVATVVFRRARLNTKKASPIAGEADNRNSGMLGSVTNALAGLEVLLIRRAKEPNLGYWSLPGGRLEVGETIEAGAVREVKEETGIDVRALRPSVVDLTAQVSGTRAHIDSNSTLTQTVCPAVLCVDAIQPKSDNTGLAFHYVILDCLAVPEYEIEGTSVPEQEPVPSDDVDRAEWKLALEVVRGHVHPLSSHVSTVIVAGAQGLVTGQFVPKLL